MPSCCLSSAGCFYSNALGGLKCYENPKHKVTAVPANEEEICGATFKVKKIKTRRIQLYCMFMFCHLDKLDWIVLL
jgi:hypothetical protein